MESTSKPTPRPVRKYSPIHKAAYELDLNRLTALLADGADPNARGGWKETPLLMLAGALCPGQDEDINPKLEELIPKALPCLELLLQKGASTKKRSIHKSTFWHRIVLAQSPQWLRAVLDLIKTKFPQELAHLFVTDFVGNTCLTIAASTRSLEQMQILMEFDPPVTVENHLQESVLDHLMASNPPTEQSTVIFSALAALGAKPGTKNYSSPVSILNHKVIRSGIIENLWQNDVAGVGAAFAHGMELFYFGKKPVRGLAIVVDIHLQEKFEKRAKGKVAMCGYVRSVESPTKITATISLLGNTARSLPNNVLSIRDEFTATFELDYDSPLLWVMTSMVPLKAEERAEHSCRALAKCGALREVNEGRRYPLKKDYCMVLRGDNHSHYEGLSSDELAHEREMEKILGRGHNQRMIESVAVRMSGLFYRFVPDEVSPSGEFELQMRAGDPRIEILIMNTMRRNVQLLEQGKKDVGARYLAGDRELSLSEQRKLISLGPNQCFQSITSIIFGGKP